MTLAEPSGEFSVVLMAFHMDAYSVARRVGNGDISTEQKQVE
jgi:hypothetical protein